MVSVVEIFGVGGLGWGCLEAFEKNICRRLRFNFWAQIVGDRRILRPNLFCLAEWKGRDGPPGVFL